ncbi:hypothetical protein GCM10007216_15360 [Thalassobacillus devorans]|uniref:Uncharacterized protein n=1 Tax=Thalassobacillus devorans TaxID=279813 RepID=A0ABQ1P2K6_9BACI|nr:hypothetical protein [Thalassobacillus devorans]NIK28521.1 hypothetical protein [Thalassobacillus devorans]GGC85565.1 hypothetical protein GCM10007216_15360 [Thalassobacillus devorans]
MCQYPTLSITIKTIWLQAAADEWEEALVKQMQAEILEKSDIDRAIQAYEQLLNYHEAYQVKRKLDEVYPVLDELYKKRRNK